MNKTVKKRFQIKYLGGAAFLLAFLIPVFVRSPYYLNIIIMSMMSAGLAIAFLLALRPGLVNMSLPAFWGVGAYVAAVLGRDTVLSSWVILPVTIISTAAIALGLGYILIGGSGSSGFSFVMLSQVVCMVFTQVVSNFKYLGGKIGFVVDPPDAIQLPFGVIRFTGDKVAYFYYMLLLFGLILLAVRCVYASSIGRAWSAIGMSAKLADSIGVNRFAYKLTAYVVSCTIAGALGCFYVTYQQYILPDNYSMWQNIYIQIYAILGGTEFELLGPVVGGTAMNILPEVMRVTETLSPLITGVLLICLIQFLPQGLLSLSHLPERFRARKALRSGNSDGLAAGAASIGGAIEEEDGGEDDT